MKYKMIFLLFAMNSLASCYSIYFDRMPGQSLSSMPEKFVGEYEVYEHTLSDGKKNVERNDSIYTITKTSLNLHDKDIPLLNLNDTFTVSEYKGYYFISRRRPPAYWECFILQETTRGFNGCALLLNSDSIEATKDENAIKEVKKYFPDAQVIMMKNPHGNEDEQLYAKMKEDLVIVYFKDAVRNHQYSEFVKR